MISKSLQLVVVMPVYQEEKTIYLTIVRWRQMLKAQVGDGAYRLCVINDGSKDNTALEINKAKEEDLEVISQNNQGHGGAIQVGYDYAWSTGASWIMQIDSDGQCDPDQFSKFWAGRTASKVRLGLRRDRKDGWVSFQVFILTGFWLPDANVPYRLMPRELLRVALDMVPPGKYFFLNILLSINFQSLNVMEWVPISFLERNDGVPSVKYRALSKHASLLRQEIKTLLDVYRNEGLLTRWVRRYQLNVLMKSLRDPKEVLEIGSGNRAFTRLLQAQGHRVTTMDIHTPADYVGDIKNWRQVGLKESSYDVVVAREVIEHVDCIEDIKKLCRPQGLIFLSTPHPRFDWLLKGMETLRINQKRVTAHSNLVYLANLPLAALEIRYLFLISQIGVFKNEE